MPATAPSKRADCSRLQRASRGESETSRSRPGVSRRASVGTARPYVLSVAGGHSPEWGLQFHRVPRPMTPAEREAFLAEPRVAVLSVVRGDGRPPLAAPSFYAYEPGGDI